MVNNGNQPRPSSLVWQANWVKLFLEPRAPQTFNGNTWPHIEENKTCACLTWLIHRSPHSVTVPLNMNEDKWLEMVLLKKIFHCNYRYGPDFIPQREIFSQLTPLGKYPLVNKRRILLQTGELWQSFLRYHLCSFHFLLQFYPSVKWWHCNSTFLFP